MNIEQVFKNINMNRLGNMYMKINMIDNVHEHILYFVYWKSPQLNF